MTQTTTLFQVDGREIRGLTVPGEEAIATWQRLREETEKTGLWPCLLGPDDELSFLEETLEYGRTTVEKLIEEGAYVYQSLRLSDRRRLEPVPGGAGPAIARWMASHSEGGSRESLEAELQAERPRVEVPDVDLSQYEWEEDAEPSESFQFTIPADILTREPFPAVHIALLPTRNGWEVPAFLKFGSWNACPPPEEHVGRMRRWHELYGAEVVGITHDVVEMMVANPPTERDACLRLALEQYAYCNDIVDQGVGSIAALGQTLRGGRSWYFWWD